MKIIGTCLLTIIVGLAVAAEPAASSPKKFDATRFSQTLTQCDRMASHGDDPFHVAPGLEKADMDLPAAIVACQSDVQKDPGNPRLLYQLGRSLAYSGRGTEGIPYVVKSAALGYPQAMFVGGYLYLEGIYSAPKNACKAAAMIHESAQYGRMAGQVGFPAWYLAGRFKGCDVRQDPAEMISFLEAAKATKPEFYHQLLIEDLLRQLRQP